MANLIVTILSIALVAVLALAAIFYGGDMFYQGRVRGKVAAMYAQNSQLFAMGQQYLVNHNYTSFKSCGGSTGGMCASGASFADDDFVLEHYATSRIPVMNYAVDWNLYGSMSYRQYTSSGVWSFFGADEAPSGGGTYRAPCTVDGKNVIIYNFYANSANFYTASANDPIVKICNEVNKNVTFPPGTTFAANGIPLAVGNMVNSIGCGGSYIYYFDGSGKNYCYLMSPDGTTNDVPWLNYYNETPSPSTRAAKVEWLIIVFDH